MFKDFFDNNVWAKPLALALIVYLHYGAIAIYSERKKGTPWRETFSTMLIGTSILAVPTFLFSLFFEIFKDK